MKKEIIATLILTTLCGFTTSQVYAENLPMINPDLSITMPDAVYSGADNSVLHLKMNLNYAGVSKTGSFLWELKPDAYDIISNTTNIPPQEVDCSTPSLIAAGEARTFNNRNAAVDYIINCKYAVHGDLTINPGVTIQFGTDAGLVIYNDASIQSLGTAQQPVVLTGEDKTAGSWLGVFIDSNDTKNTLQFTRIDYAGGAPFNSNGDLGAVIVWSDTHLKMTNTTIRHSASYGFNASYGRDELMLKDNTITSGKAPMIMLAAYPTMISGGTYSGNEMDAIVVKSDQLTGQHTWTELGVPYRISNSVSLQSGANLTIQPGVTLEFEDNGSLDVNENASGDSSLIAIGTNEKPIVFTAVNKISAAWQGLRFDTLSPLNEVAFATIAHAGNPDQAGAIYMWAGPVLNVHHVTFSDIQNCAFYEGTASNSDFPNLTTSHITYNNVGDEMCSK